jgi:hypothetical protein
MTGHRLRGRDCGGSVVLLEAWKSTATTVGGGR